MDSSIEDIIASVPPSPSPPSVPPGAFITLTDRRQKSETATVPHRRKSSPRDITKQFRAAAAELRTGELVKDDFFPLQEAVGAVEIMDPKMDSGFLKEGESLEDNFDVLSMLSPSETVGIMDQMICHEEEDFVTNLYHRPLLSDVPWENIINLLENVNTWLIDHASAEEVSPSFKVAISERLKLRINMLCAMGFGLSGPTSEHRLRWNLVLESLNAVSATHDQGVLVEAAFSERLQRQLASTTPPRPIINLSFGEAREYFAHLCRNGQEVYGILDCTRPSTALTFAMSFQSRSPQTCTYIRCLLQALVFHEMKVLGSISIRRFLFDDFEEVAMPANILVDPANELAEAPQGARFKIFRNMDAFVLRVGDAFLDIFRAVSMNRCRMRRMLCHLIMDWDTVQLDAENLDVQLQDLTGEIPRETPASSEKIWSFPVSSWAYYHKLHQMEWIIQLGFELNIYQNDEIGGMYWYLQQLTSTRIQHLERIFNFSVRGQPRLSMSSSMADQKRRQASVDRTTSFLEIAILEASAIHAFARALTILYSFLASHALLPFPYLSFPYSTPQLRYALRTKPFLSLSIPDVPSYADFISDYTQMGGPSSSSTDNKTALQFKTLDTATTLLKTARKEFEALSKLDRDTARCEGSLEVEQWWKQGIKDQLRGCIAAGISIVGARKGVDLMATAANDNAAEVRVAAAVAAAAAGEKEKRGGEPDLSLKDVLEVKVGDSEEGYHPWWRVPKVVVRDQVGGQQ